MMTTASHTTRRSLPMGDKALPLPIVVVAWMAVLAASSHFSVPIGPVPLTMQTLAVTCVGAFLGPRLGTVTVVGWLIAGALGLPVLAPGGAPGIARFVGPTAGYLVAFPFAAALVGWLVERGSKLPQTLHAFGAMVIGNLLCLGVGATWLALHVGLEKSLLVGVVPFLTGALLKSVLGAAFLKLWRSGRCSPR